MEAKDTAFTDVTPLKLLQNQQELLGLLREQAEVSFKAGQEDVCTVSVSEIMRKGIEQGRKEVVEWVNENTHWRKDAPYKSVLDPDDWKPQLKKWGIKN